MCIWKAQTALEKSPAATKYKKQVEMIKKVWIGAKLPPLYPINYSLLDPKINMDLPVDEVSDQATTPDASDHRQGKGGSRKIQAHASNEDHSLETFTKNSDEGQHEQCVLFTPELEAGSESATWLGAVFDFERFGKLDAPFVLKFGHAEKCGTHDGDDEGCEDAERSLPDVLGA